jgi:hypothetical protein
MAGKRLSPIFTENFAESLAAIRDFQYFLLYLVRRSQVIFLSIKHHRRLSFDLHRFWP